MRRVTTGLARVLIFAWAVVLALPASAQTILPPAISPSTIAISTRTRELDDLLHSGRQLELERRWADALSHYEEGLRRYPGEILLQRRYDSSRLHYDLQRRANDRSFRESLGRMPFDQALDLYAQVLLMIEANYVDAPNWQDLVERGTNDLEVALGDRAFVERNVPLAHRAQAAPFAPQLRSILGTRAVGNRQEAREAAAFAAALAAERLGIPPTAVVLEYLCGATNSLDQYSAFLTPDQLNEVYSQIDGNFVGLGVELKTQNNILRIVRVIPGSPAEEAGIREGDRIAAIDGKSVGSMSTDLAANLLQGEEGSLVHLVVAAADGRERQTSIRRRRVEVPSIDQIGMIDRERGIGYFRITSFQKTTLRELDAALWKLHREGMQRLIIDVRNNPGGLLPAAVDVSDRFVERGVIVTTRGRSAQEDATYVARETNKWRIPLVVIVDQDSASAAEIFSGAIHDLKRGTIVGVRSYGKGSVQGIFQLNGAGAGIRLTTAKFYSPNGKPYSHVGVEPDFEVRQAAKPIEGGVAVPTQSDRMLDAALEVARGANAAPRQARSSR
ncbi:MAG: S41 family peptidase [Pirellulales bacterium]|nr:S41 family peptidase [Pirellulales bacterium]